MPDFNPSDEWIETAAAMLGLPLPSEWTPEVRANLQATLAHGMRVASFPLPDDAEPAPVFEA